MKKAPTKKSQAGGGPPLAPADEREPGRLAGKRFSRVRIIGRGTVWFGVGPDGKLSDEQSQQLKRLRAGARSDDYAELVAAFKAKAAEAADFLRERGLPGTPNVLTLKEGDEWSDDAIEYDCEVYMASVRAGWPPGAVETVDHYLIEYKGFDPDSPEALAARVLIWTQAFECRGPLTKDAVVAAYRLGELSALERAYSIDRDRAQKPKPRQQAEKWREFARMLIRQDPGRSPEHYWESLTDETREFGSADIYRDGETLVWSEGGKVTPIQYRTFRRHVERAQADWRSKKAHRRADGLAT